MCLKPTLHLLHHNVCVCLLHHQLPCECFVFTLGGSECVCVCVTDAICSEISSWILCSRWDLCLQQTHTYTQCQPLAIPVDTLTHTCMSRCHVGQLACIYVRLDGSGGEAVVCMCTFLWILAELNC